jgi:hypothetical protein
MVWVQILVEGEQNNCQLKNIILTLLYMYIEVYKFIYLFVWKS